MYVCTGVAEARLLLNDWLINLTACYNDNMLGISRNATEGVVDVTFRKVTSLSLMMCWSEAVLV